MHHPDSVSDKLNVDVREIAKIGLFFKVKNSGAVKSDCNHKLNLL